LTSELNLQVKQIGQNFKTDKLLEERLHARVDVVPKASLRQEFREQVLKEVRYL
jgi:predicted nucleotidyltransferase